MQSGGGGRGGGRVTAVPSQRRAVASELTPQASLSAAALLAPEADAVAGGDVQLSTAGSRDAPTFRGSDRGGGA